MTYSPLTVRVTGNSLTVLSGSIRAARVSLVDWFSDASLFADEVIPSVFYRQRAKSQLSVAEKSQVETDVQNNVVKYARKRGVIAFKWSSQSQRSVPDYLFIMKGGRAFYIEFKRPGGSPSDAQLLKIQALRSLGAHVYVCDDKAMGRSIVDVELLMTQQVTNA